MKIRKPKSSKSPNYLPPGSDPTCGEPSPFGVPWGCTREAGHEESSPEGKRDHAAHHDLQGLVTENYDRDHPLMVARWGND